LDHALLYEVRALAAEEGKSISALLAALLEQIVRERKTYERARKRALTRLRAGFDLRWKPSGSRDEVGGKGASCIGRAYEPAASFTAAARSSPPAPGFRSW
jgi:hypothetical protein